MTDRHALTTMIGLTRSRAQTLQRALDAQGTPDPHLLLEAVQELYTAIEELQVADEELRQQNDELAAARNEAEGHRRRFEEHFRFAPEAYFVTDTAGTIREANRAAAALLGVEEQFLPGKPLAVYFPEPDRREFLQRLPRLAGGEKSPPFDATLSGRGGGPSRSVAVSAEAATGPAGTQPIIRWLFRDTTEVKRLTAELRHLDSRLWYSVAENTRSLSAENDRLRADLANLKAGKTPPAGPPLPDGHAGSAGGHPGG